MNRAILYRLTDPSGKVYIGTTLRTLTDRFFAHWNKARRGVTDTEIARSLRQYGPDSFRREILAFVEPQERYATEKRAIAAFGSLCPSGLNMTGGGRGGRMPDAVQARSAEKMRELWADESRRKAWVAATSAGKRTKAARAKSSESAKARWRDPATREMLTARIRQGQSDPEVRRRMSESQKKVWERKRGGA